MDSTLVIYTGTPLPNASIPTNTSIHTILPLIDAALGSSSSAPDYSGYSLACVTQTDGSSHPTNTQNFAEGISKILCDLKTAYTAFTGTTYVSNQSVITTAINALQTPALTYSASTGGGSITITSGMTRNQVLTATYTAVGSILALLAAPGNTWASLSITTPVTILAAFNALIADQVTQNTTISGKQASLGTFNTTPIGGSSGQTPINTINAILTYVGALPEFTAGSVSSTCVSAGTDLQEYIQNICTIIDSLSVAAVTTAGTGLTLGAPAGCGGKTLSIDTSWTGLYKVKNSSGDASPNYLASKLESSDSTITITDTGSLIDLKVATPESAKVKVNVSDATSGYLSDKFTTAGGNWGLQLQASASPDNSQLYLTPNVTTPAIFAQNLMSYIQTDPNLLTQFANLISTSQNVPGLGITDVLVTLTAGHFIYTWTPQSGVSQQAKWRAQGTVVWSTNYLTPANPLSSVDATTDVPSSATGNNAPLQFQVDTVYPTGLVSSNIYENIKFNCQSDTHGHTAGVINISQPALVGVSIIEYRLILNAGSVLQETIITTGLSPSVTFASVAAGTYHVEWRYGTSINGSTLYSDDASQLNAMCSSSNIVIT